MVDSGGVVFGNRPRRRHALSEKRRIVELTFQPGASVAEVARANGVNANQLFGWRRAFERGELVEYISGTKALLPVTLSAGCESPIRKSVPQQQPSASGSIHIEFPGRALISVESGADAALLRSILEILRRRIQLPTGTKIWLAAGVTDVRRGFDGLSAQVQTVLNEQPFSGHVFVFGGRRGDIVKVLWFDGDGLCLFAKCR
jgi:transposase-like protein